MILKAVKNTLIYNELEEIRNIEFFDRKDKQFLHNVDSLYYVIKVKNDWNYDSGVQLFLSVLEIARKQAIKSFDPHVLFQAPAFSEFELGTEFLMNGIGSKPYTYDISKTDKYTMFVLSHQLNSNTPEIWVQLRSESLWLQGEYAALEESLRDIERVLSAFEIEIQEVKENRIDYAYHTNYIQNPTNYFQPKNFNKMQKSRFERWSLEGSFSGEFDTDADYLTLGRKKSNNLFFRIYDKTKEVIEMGYKQFFIKLWYLEKMISYFDLYCIEKAFLNPSRTKFKYLDIARLEFYLEFGNDQAIKNKIEKLIKQDTLDYPVIKKLADKLVPKVTIILNVEIETKRKFYYSMDNSIASLLDVKTLNAPDYAKKLYLIMDNKQVFHNLLTCNNDKQEGIIRFLNFTAKNKNGVAWTRKKEFPTSDFWTRLQKTKVVYHAKSDDVKLMREYQQTLSAELLKRRITNAITTHSLYVHGEDVDNDIFHDALDYMSTLNENDIQKSIEYKKKKLTLLKNRLDSVENLSNNDRDFHIYDSLTGESIKTLR